VLINDKSQLKRSDEQIGFQLALKTSKSLHWSDTQANCSILLDRQ